MKMNLEDIEKIENYIEGNLPANEMETLKNDAQFQQDVKVQMDLHKAVIHQGEKNLKAELETYYNEYKSNNKSEKNTRTIILRVIAAAAVLLIVVTIGIKLGNNDKGTNNLAEDTMLQGEKTEAPEFGTKKVYEAITLESYDFKNNVLKLYGKNFNSSQVALYKIKNKVYIENGSDVYMLNENTLEIENSDLNLDTYKDLIPSTENKVTVIFIENRQIIETAEKTLKEYK